VVRGRGGERSVTVEEQKKNSLVWTLLSYPAVGDGRPVVSRQRDAKGVGDAGREMHWSERGRETGYREDKEFRSSGRSSVWR
jgi:hypothetical protein